MSDRSYKRGAIMGLTVAEAFILLAFCLLLLFTWWQLETERKSLAVMDELGEMSEVKKQQIVDLIADGTIDTVLAMKEAGLGKLGATSPQDARDMSRFMSEAELRRLMKGAAELPKDTLLSLSDLVEIGDNAAIVSVMNRIRSEASDTGDPADVIARRIAGAAAAQDALYLALNGALGDQIRGAGGSIDRDGTISLPQSVLFDVSDDKIKNPGFLREFCTPWLETMRNSGVDISELKIEGHASSEGPQRASPEAAYLYNLDLSQRRAQNALTVCLNSVKGAETQNWGREHLIAVGYSSTRPVMDDAGAENREKSRRVMFSVAVDRQKLLDDISSDLGQNARQAPASH